MSLQFVYTSLIHFTIEIVQFPFTKYRIFVFQIYKLNCFIIYSHLYTLLELFRISILDCIYHIPIVPRTNSLMTNQLRVIVNNIVKSKQLGHITNSMYQKIDSVQQCNVISSKQLIHVKLYVIQQINTILCWLLYVPQVICGKWCLKHVLIHMCSKSYFSSEVRLGIRLED